MKIFQKIRGDIGAYLADFFEKRAEIKIKNKYPALWENLSHYLEKSKSTGCEYGDYLVLYSHIRKYKPKYVLECGSGVSTIVISQALLENSEEGLGGKLISLEESEDYYKHLLSIFPEKYKEFSEILLRKAIEKTRDIFRGVGYEDIPKHDYEFVFIDGPNYMTNPNKQPMSFNYDLIEVIEMSSKPVRAIIDTRTSTAFVYFLILGNKFRYDYIRRLGFVGLSTKDDLASTRKIVSRFMKKRPFKRPGIFNPNF